MKDIRRLNLSAVAEIHCLQRLRDKYNNFFSLPAPINRADTTEEHCFFFPFTSTATNIGDNRLYLGLSIHVILLFAI